MDKKKLVTFLSKFYLDNYYSAYIKYNLWAFVMTLSISITIKKPKRVVTA